MFAGRAVLPDFPQREGVQMIADRIRAQKSTGAAGPRERKRTRAGRYIVLIFGAGVVSGTAALAGIPPFGSVQALLSPVSQLRHPRPEPAPINASAIFPPVPPVHKVVDVYDPPPPAQKSNPAPQPPATSPRPKASPSPPLHSSPSPTPHDD
jgi:hypothetical protein